MYKAIKCTYESRDGERWSIFELEDNKEQPYTFIENGTIYYFYSKYILFYWEGEWVRSTNFQFTNSDNERFQMFCETSNCYENCRCCFTFEQKRYKMWINKESSIFREQRRIHMTLDRCKDIHRGKMVIKELNDSIFFGVVNDPSIMCRFCIPIDPKLLYMKQNIDICVCDKVPYHISSIDIGCCSIFEYTNDVSYITHPYTKFTISTPCEVNIPSYLEYNEILDIFFELQSKSNNVYIVESNKYKWKYPCDIIFI